MKKVAQFRRSTGANAGFSEKLAWQLSKGPATGRELAERLGMTLCEFNRLVLHIMRRGGETLQVEATNKICLGGGSIDRTYNLVRNPRRIARSPSKPMVINHRNDCSEEQKKRNCKAAKRRARLIASGIYMECMG